MNIRDLKYFLALAELEHFGQAAEHCNVSQPTLSGQIKKLENQLGIILFERTNRRVMLTESGRQIARSANKVLREVDSIYEIAKSSSDPMAGKFRLGAFPTLSTYVFPTIVPKVKEIMPDLRLILIEEKTSYLIQKLRNGDIDAALLALPIHDDFLLSEELFDDEFYLAVPPGHELTKFDKIEQKNYISIVAKRVKRSEGIFFKILYELHKILTLLFTGKNMNFGNFSCLTKADVKKISESATLWNNFPSTVKQKIKSLDFINCIRGTRYFGPSKMSLIKLIILSFSIISVFRLRVFLISSIYIILMFFVDKFLVISAFKPFLVTIILFNLVIFILSLRANRKEFDNCLTNIQSINNILH